MKSFSKWFWGAFFYAAVAVIIGLLIYNAYAWADSFNTFLTK